MCCPCTDTSHAAVSAPTATRAIPSAISPGRRRRLTGAIRGGVGIARTGAGAGAFGSTGAGAGAFGSAGAGAGAGAGSAGTGLGGAGTTGSAWATVAVKPMPATVRPEAAATANDVRMPRERDLGVR